MFKKLIPHISIILSLILLTFVILDQFNPGLNFLGNDVFKIGLAIFCVAAFATSVFLSLENRKKT